MQVRFRNFRIDPISSNASGWTLAAISLVGVAAFLYPFLIPTLADEQTAHASDAPLIFALITGSCLLASLMVTGDAMHGTERSRVIALLGVLVAFDSLLRLIPGVLGASPVFPLMILVGYVFGAMFGFQMGALTVLLSAFITGGVGPWLPFQMITAGWLGMSAGWLPTLRTERRQLLVLVAFGAFWGLLFGAIMNLWFWPFTAPGVEADAGLYWNPELGGVETLERYATFYLTTSVAFDVARAIANAVLTVVFGLPVLRMLQRFNVRHTWVEYVPE